ncbi:MAG TPA: SGNH/GDSL hydrolase family protein [Acidobacteriota bacterium]
MSAAGRRSREWAGRLLLAAAPLLLLESGLRLAGVHYQPRPIAFVGRQDEHLGDPHYYLRPSTICLWEPRPRARFPISMRGRVNRNGYRGPHLRRIPKPGTLRLALAGDSCVLGYRLRQEESIADQLERQLAQKLDRPVEVLNSGCTGHSTVLTYERLKAGVFDYRPRFVVLYLGQWNDYVPALGFTDREALEATRLRHRTAQLQDMLARLRTYQLLHSVLEPLLRGRRPIPQEQRAILDFRAGREPSLRRVPLADFRATVADMIRLCRQHGAIEVGLIPPVPRATLARIPAGRMYRDALIEVYRRQRVPLVDARPLDEHPEAFIDWIHPSALGAALIAQGLSQKLAELALADDSTHPSP